MIGRIAAPVLALGAALIGCVERVQLDRDDLPGLAAIEVSPGDTTVSLVLPGSPRTVAYRATGRFADGEVRDITALVDWTTDNAYPGAFTAGGQYTTSNAAAGHVRILASHRGVTGAAALTVAIATTVIDDVFPPPAGAAALFAPGTQAMTDPMRSPAILYPADATVFPQELTPIVFQYRASMMTDAFRLAFDSDVLHLEVFSGTDRWRPDAPTWTLLERSHPGASAMFEVDAASSTAPGTIFAGSRAALGFARGAASGALYYVAGGILRGDLAQPVATKLYPLAGDSARVAEPGVSRDGATMALAYNDSLRTLDLATLDPVTTSPGPVGALALSPDGRLVIVSNMGMLQLRDARTGKGVGSPDGRVMLGAMATDPDWAPDGTAIAVAVGAMVTSTDLKGGSIARVPYLGNGAWGSPQMLVASTGDMDNNFSPRWSPDGAYIAYVHTDGPVGDASAELRIVAAGGGNPIALTRASHRVAGMEMPGLASSMPAWAPAAREAPAAQEMMWLAFVSSRAYGAARPMPGKGQIWIAAFDPAQLASGDPSAAAFWLPAQDITAVGTSPAWGPAIPATPFDRSPSPRR